RRKWRCAACSHCGSRPCRPKASRFAARPHARNAARRSGRSPPASPNIPGDFVVIRERPGDDRIVAEVAHEAFPRTWPRLGGWLRAERDFLVFKSETERAERRWREMGQLDNALLTGFDLARAEEWLPTRSEDLSPDVEAFVQKSIAADRAEKSRQLVFQRRVSIASTLAALLMAAIVVFAWFQVNRATNAESLARLNESRGLSALSRVAAHNGSFSDAMHLALAAWPRTTGDPRPRLPVVLDSLAFGLSSLVPVRGQYRHDGPVRGALLNRDETRILSWSDDQTVRL